MPECGDEIWGLFDSDDEAIKALNARYKNDKRERAKAEKEFREWRAKKYPERKRYPRRQPDHWWWIIERLGHVKPNTLVHDFHLPWKTIFICQRGGD